MHHVSVRTTAKRQVEFVPKPDQIGKGVVFAVVKDAPDRSHAHGRQFVADRRIGGGPAQGGRHENGKQDPIRRKDDFHGETPCWGATGPANHLVAVL